MMDGFDGLTARCLYVLNEITPQVYRLVNSEHFCIYSKPRNRSNSAKESTT